MQKKLQLTDIRYSNYLKVLGILFAILPIALLTGPFLPDLIVSFFAINLIFFANNIEIKKIFKNIIIQILILFCFLNIILSLLSENILFSLEASLFYIRFIFFSIFSYFLISKDKKILDKFLICILISFTIVITFALIEFLFTKLNIYIDSNREQISGIFGKEQILGSYISRNLPILFYLILLNKNNRLLLFFSLIILFFSQISVFLSGERTAFVLLIMQMILILLTLKNFKRTRIIIFLSSILFFVVFSFFVPEIKQRIIYKTLNATGLGSLFSNSELYQNKKIYIFSIDHHNHYISSYRMFLDKPLLGHGPKMFRVKCELEEYNPTGCSTHPHNIYLQLLAETGMIGFLIIFYFFIATSYVLFKNTLVNFFTNKSYLSDKQSLIYISFFLTLWPIIPSGNLYNNWLNVIYYIPLVFYLNELNRKKYDK